MKILISILNWIKGPGIKPLSILIVGIVVYFLFKNIVSRAMEALIMRQERRKGRTQKEQELRAKTLSRVISWAVSIIMSVIIIFMFLQSLGINISALLAGAGVVGLAIGLGVRSLITDYINGFFILVEDQFSIGDTINVGNVSGKVKDFNLRRTVVEDEKGAIYTIPNGQVKIVSNLSRKEK